MDFTFSALILMPIIGILGSLLLAWQVSDTGHNHNSRTFKKTFLVSQLILISVGNLIMLGSSTMALPSGSEKEYTGASICDVMNQMGVRSKKSYPARIGAHMDGTQGDGYFQTRLFSGEGTASITPGSSLRVSVDHPAESLMLEIPLEHIKFTKGSRNAQPTIAFRFDCTREVNVSQMVHYGPSHLRLDSGVFVMTRDEIGRDKRVLDMSSAADGLTPLVASTLKSAEIRLSPGLYDKILG